IFYKILNKIEYYDNKFNNRLFCSRIMKEYPIKIKILLLMEDILRKIIFHMKLNLEIKKKKLYYQI
ncbi:hypothetical protein, partial [Candidatus Nanopusillus massiliensis]|uniref:hypothetical protein n=1 Tax=Candidatus Nanopusillus massiliensis TaxID=2897163 RepID=UPI001E5EE6F6